MVVFLLKTTKPSIYREVRKFVRRVKGVSKTKLKRLYTHDFLDLFNKIETGNVHSNNFKTVRDITNLKKGDIIVYLPEGRRRNGHMGIVTSDMPTIHSETLLSVDFLHAPTFGSSVTISPLFIHHHNNCIHGISWQTQEKQKNITTAQIARIRET